MEPYKIEHLKDVIEVNGEIEQVYNYLINRFEGFEAYIWARACLDEIKEVSLYGPFTSSNDLTQVDNPDLHRVVLDYLHFRFRVVKELGPNGYVTIK